MNLTTEQIDRARGALLGTATGDALGAGYEFSTPAFEDGQTPEMIGGGIGNFAPGEWTDDTSMMWCIGEVAAMRRELDSEEAMDDVARNFRDWLDTRPPDVGIQTGAVLRGAGPNPTAAAMRAAADQVALHRKNASGNGSLMRTAPVALPYLDQPEMVNQVARQLSALTHPDAAAQEACALWSLAIRHAIVHGEFDLRAQFTYLGDEAVEYWDARITEAETRDPETFKPNGWSVSALQAAWSSIVATPIGEGGGPQHFRDVMTRAIGIGHDTDTVAAIAGALVGARWGASQIPEQWSKLVHGYPEMVGADLVDMADAAVNEVPVSAGRR